VCYSRVSGVWVSRRFSISYLIFGCAILSLWAAAQEIVPITKERNHQLTISNDYVRVFKVEVPPKTETLYHQHDYDYLYVVIGDADITSTHLNEKPVSAKMRDGEVGFAKGGFAHKALNNGDEPFDNVTVELLKGAGRVICGTKETRPCAGKGKNPGTTVLLLDTEKVSVRSFGVAANTSVGAAELGTGPAVVVPTGDMDVEVHKSGAVSYGVILLGEPRWFGAGETRTIKNSWLKDARLILIDFK